MQKPDKFREITPPKWIVKLKPGRYYIEDLIKITKFTNSAISVTIKKYGATVEKEPCHYNLFRNIFIWNGYDPDYRLKQHLKKLKDEKV